MAYEYRFLYTERDSLLCNNIFYVPLKDAHFTARASERVTLSYFPEDFLTKQTILEMSRTLKK